ncbi:MAG: M1 family aminopeptidase [Bacteroidota bacterium]
MKAKKILSSLCLLLVVVTAFAQQASENHTERHAIPQQNGQKTTIADLGESDYDIKHLKFDLKMSDTSVFVRGNVTTNAIVTAASMGTYVFELDSLITVDSAKVNGQLLPVTTAASVRKMTLPTALPVNTAFTAQVFYHGTPPGGSGFFNGITLATSTGGTKMVYTVSDPYVAKNWWPCKQEIDDKIDSVDMWVTVPSGVRVGSNGLLKHIDSTSTPGYWQHQWKTKYPIDYYLISVAIARYVVDSSHMHFTGSTDSMLIQNFFFDTATFYPANKSNFDTISQIVDYWSQLFGRYPFWQEKYGISYTNLPGGMEHQTMTTIGVPNTYIIAHELCHQWFGDNVTYKYWGHVWLSEGFATYAEQLYYTHFWSPAMGKSHRQAAYSNAMSQLGGSVYVTDTSSATTLFDQRLVYNKASAVVHMLRFLAPQDSLFFNVLKTYQQQYTGGLATTEDLKAIAQNIYGMNLDTFFNQWIYGQGYPRFSIAWNQIGASVYVKLSQITTVPTSVPLFYTPLELQLHANAGDTIVRVYSNAPSQIYSFTWADTMTNVLLEPNLWILCKINGAVVHDATLGVATTDATDNIKVYPNPTNNVWLVEHLVSGSQLKLMDMNGRTVWKGTSDKDSTTIPAQKLPTGNYQLQISTDNKTKQTIRLVRW